MFKRNDWIKKQVLLDIVNRDGLMPGMTGHGNHPDCSAGEDTRERLYVTVTESGTLLGYCHNCGSRGAYSETGTSNIYTKHIHVPKGKWEPPCIWTSANPVNLVTPFAINELNDYYDKWHINYALANEDGWRYNYDNEVMCFVLMFPCYDKDGELCGIQKRHLLDKDTLKRMALPKIQTFGRASPHLMRPKEDLNEKRSSN